MPIEAPIYIGCISSKYLPERDNNLIGDKRASCVEGFFGCDEYGAMYINGHKIPDRYAGFKRGSTVGIEIDYTDDNKKATGRKGTPSPGGGHRLGATVPMRRFPVLLRSILQHPSAQSTLGPPNPPRQSSSSWMASASAPCARRLRRASCPA